MISVKTLKIILQTLLLSIIAIVPFIKIKTLYFPFVSGKVYLFRLLIFLASFFWIWLIIKMPKEAINKRFLAYKNVLVIGFVLFLGAQIVVSFFGVSPAVSFFSTLERQDGVIQYGFWILYFIMLVFAFREEKDWKILSSVYVGTAFFVSCFAWLNFKDQPRLEGVFGNPSYMAAFLLFAIGFCFISVERKFFNGYFLNSIFLGAAGLFMVTLFYTQTRGAYLGLAAAVFVFCLLSILFLRNQNKKIAVSCGIILLVGVISFAAIFIARDTSFVKNSPLSRITEVTQFWELGSIRERILNWEITLKAFKDKPIFGYGPENFMVAFNKFYDYRIGKEESWFDRAHNQFIEPLATGGIVLFSFYLFSLFSVFYIILKIAKKEKILSFILASIFLAYIVQGLFLFDTLPIYLGLFPFLAFVICFYNYIKGNITDKPQEIKKENKFYFYLNKWQKPILVVTAFACVFGIYTAVFLPYTASAAAIQFLADTSQGNYKEAMLSAKKTFEINSPYTYWELKKRIGWQFLDIIGRSEKFTDQQVKDLGSVYDLIVPELERFVQNRPYDPQIYYVLPSIYRLGTEKLGKNDLEKAYNLLQQAFKYSDLRLEYYNEMALVLLAENKFSEGEKMLQDYVKRVQAFPYFSYLTMGHYYYVAGKYDLAMENYIKAKEAGYDFCENRNEYSRYIDSAQNTKEYNEIVDMSLKFIQENGPEADIYFNVALAYYYIGDKAEAKEFFNKTIDLDKDKYQQYASFFNL